MSETNRIEYKRELTKEVDLEKEVIAFLNAHEGGVIFIGIDKNGNTYGVSDMDGDMLKIKDRLKTNIQPSCLGLFNIVSIEKENKELIKIEIASGTEKPYYRKKKGMSPEGCYIRMGTASEPMEQRMIDELYAKRTRNSIGKIKSNRQDLTFEQLKIYYEGKGTPLNKNFAKSLELVTQEGAFNYVAYLMADENGTSIKVAKYNGKKRTDLIENPDYGYESLIKATKSVLDKIEFEDLSGLTDSAVINIEIDDDCEMVLTKAQLDVSLDPADKIIATAALRSVTFGSGSTCDLTNMEISNASLLDEGTAAAEAMTMLYNTRGNEKKAKNYNYFFIDENIFPQTLSVLETRSDPLGIKLLIGDPCKIDFSKKIYAGIIQNPGKNGQIQNLNQIIKKMSRKKNKNYSCR